MNRLSRLLPLGAVLLAAALVAHGVWRWKEARGRFDSADARLATVRHEADAIHTLRQQEEQVSIGARPKDDVIAIVNEALQHAGLPSDRFADLRNESDIALPGAGAAGGPNYRRQSVAFTLRGMSPGDLGLFLNSWRTRQRVWSVARLTLTAARGPQDTAGRFDIALTISSLYLGDA